MKIEDKIPERRIEDIITNCRLVKLDARCPHFRNGVFKEQGVNCVKFRCALDMKAQGRKAKLYLSIEEMFKHCILLNSKV